LPIVLNLATSWKLLLQENETGKLLRIDLWNTPFNTLKNLLKVKPLYLLQQMEQGFFIWRLQKMQKYHYGLFPNLSSVCKYLIAKKQNVVLACAAWKDKVNMEDTLFAGAVISRIKSTYY
jgi:2-phosphosulfolactate phosphatase